MRIIAGTLGGRIFEAKGNATHPMSEKVRGALFNSLGDVGNLDFLDAFSGTGAISFEAISRGANSSLAIESDKLAQRNIAENIDLLKLKDKVTLARSTINSWTTNNTSKKFDVIICDPPFDKLQLSTVARLDNRLRTGGLLVLSLPKSTKVPEFKNIKMIDQKGYGDGQLVFYRNNQ